jgi:hypothetical protein
MAYARRYLVAVHSRIPPGRCRIATTKGFVKLTGKLEGERLVIAFILLGKTNSFLESSASISHIWRGFKTAKQHFDVLLFLELRVEFDFLLF